MRRAAAALAIALGLAACQAPQGTGPSASSSAASSASPRALPAPAGPEVLALLDGLSVGDQLGAASVKAIGAIDQRGVIPIVIEQGASISVIVVAAKTQSPAPPVNTRSYSLFYERFDDRAPLPSQQLSEALRAVAARLEKTQDKLPVPPALKPLARPGAPA